MKATSKRKTERAVLIVAALAALTLAFSADGAGPAGVLAQGRWTVARRLLRIASMKGARAFATATTLASGKVLVCGGLDGSYRYLASAELFDPTLKRFTSLPAMIAPRASHTATLLPGGQVLIAGGVTCSKGRCTTLDSAEIYDPALNRFYAIGTMTSARASHTATLLADGRVLLVGGLSDEAISSAEIFDPTSATFVETATMLTPRYFHTATLLNDGEVLVTGGRSCADECDRNPAGQSAELYDPGRRQFFPASNLREGRILHNATRMPDGRVLITGGRSCVGDCEGDRTLQNAEIYDPGTDQFAAGGTMVAARAAHQAVALGDGQIFIYGGDQCSRRSGCRYFNSGELYDSSTGTFIPAATGTVAGGHSIAALLPSHEVLVAGGRVVGKIESSADVFSFPPN